MDKPNTDKVKLIPVEAIHIDEINKMYEDSIAREMQGIDSPPDIDYFTDKNNKCYVILGEDGEFVGTVELFNISWKNRRAEYSITISPSHRGKGYGYDATRMLLDIGFHQLGLNRIWLRVLEYNNKAIGLYKKVGFIKEGICREESFRRGKFVNQIQMSILRREWV